MLKAFRMTVVLAVLGAAGIAVSAVRVEQARSIARIQRLRLEQRTLLIQLHDGQLRTARLRSPDTVNRRVTQWNLDLEVPPDHGAPPIHHPHQLALAGGED